MKTFSTIIKTVIIALIALFAAFNMQMVDIKYFFNVPPIQLPLFVIVIAAFIIGVLITGFVSFGEKMKLKREINNYKKQVKELEKEIVRLKNLPLSREDTAEKNETISK